MEIIKNIKKKLFLRRPKKINKSKIKDSKLNLLAPNSNFVLLIVMYVLYY